MFGKRPDGIMVKNIDPLVMMTPYIMPQRVDAQVFLDSQFKYEPLINYISEKAREGFKITFMEILSAAFVRAVSQNPEINRFISNRKLYSRKGLCISLVVVKESVGTEVEEAVIKVDFDLTDTIFDVAARIKKEVIENRKPEKENLVSKLIRVLMRLPGLPNFFIALVRVLDKYTLLPKFLIDISPFHTSLFITNMASIGMEKVYHHIYNFGTTSIFLSLGAIKKSLKLQRDGSVKRVRMLPIGVTVDERVCAGKVYAQFFAEIKKYMEDPCLLEIEPETVKYDTNCEYHVDKPDLSCIKIN